MQGEWGAVGREGGGLNIEHGMIRKKPFGLAKAALNRGVVLILSGLNSLNLLYFTFLYPTTQ